MKQELRHSQPSYSALKLELTGRERSPYPTSAASAVVPQVVVVAAAPRVVQPPLHGGKVI